jgi:hypothetical protein
MENHLKWGKFQKLALAEEKTIPLTYRIITV